MTWYMATWLRAGFVIMGVVFAGVGAYLMVVDVKPLSVFDLALGVVMIGAAVEVAATGLRSALVAAGDTLTVRSAFRAKTIARAEITAINSDSGGVMISYTRDGRIRTTTADAGQGLLSSVGGKLLRRETHTQHITEQLNGWWHAGNGQPQHATGN